MIKINQWWWTIGRTHSCWFVTLSHMKNMHQEWVTLSSCKNMKQNADFYSFRSSSIAVSHLFYDTTALVSYPNTHIVQFSAMDYWSVSSTIILFSCKIGHRCVTRTDVSLPSPSLINQLSNSQRKSQVISKTVINNKNIRPDHSRDPRKLSKSGKKETWNSTLIQRGGRQVLSREVQQLLSSANKEIKHKLFDQTTQVILA